MKKRNSIELIIDRVGNVNIFNLTKTDDIPITGDFKTIVDDDLIEEYIETTQKLYNVFIAEISDNKINSNRINELEELSLEFYKQIFPESIQNYLLHTKNQYLYLRLDENLNRIPWELLYNGENFLCQHFFIGRGTKCDYRLFSANNKEKHPIKILIICDPTDTLTWAPIETEKLKEKLSQLTLPCDFNIEILSNNNLSKLKLMNTLKDKDIVHFIGHSIEDENIIENSGWKIGKDKTLKIREIAKSNVSLPLVFSHSCKSANHIAKAFIEAGVKHFIGCRYDVLESEHAVNFASSIYENILSGIPIGKAFNTAINKNSKSNIIAFNYVLYSNPTALLYFFERRNRKKSYIKPEEILKSFPFPIAELYRRFLISIKQKDNINAFKNLSNLLLQIIRFFSFIIINDLKSHSLFHKTLIEHLAHPSLVNWKNFLYESLSELINLRQNLEIPNIASIFYLQKENIERCIELHNQFKNKEIADEDLPELITVFQYLIENLLIDLQFITDYELYTFLDNGLNNEYAIINLKGLELKKSNKEFDEIFKKGQTILFDNYAGTVKLDFSELIQVEVDEAEININVLKSLFNKKSTFEKI